MGRGEGSIRATSDINMAPVEIVARHVTHLRKFIISVHRAKAQNSKKTQIEKNLKHCCEITTRNFHSVNWNEASMRTLLVESSVDTGLIETCCHFRFQPASLYTEICISSVPDCASQREPGSQNQETPRKCGKQKKMHWCTELYYIVTKQGTVSGKIIGWWNRKSAAAGTTMALLLRVEDGHEILCVNARCAQLWIHAIVAYKGASWEYTFIN